MRSLRLAFWFGMALARPAGAQVGAGQITAVAGFGTQRPNLVTC